MSKSKTSGHWLAPVLLLLVASLASGQGSKQGQAAPVQSSVLESKDVRPANGGVTIFIDPVTGAVREPEQEELQTLFSAAAANAQASSVPQPVTHPSGAEGLLLGDEQMVYEIAIIGPDGKLKLDSANGEKNARAKIQTAGKEQPNDR